MARIEELESNAKLLSGREATHRQAGEQLQNSINETRANVAEIKNLHCNRTLLSMSVYYTINVLLLAATLSILRARNGSTAGDASLSLNVAAATL